MLCKVDFMLTSLKYLPPYLINYEYCSVVVIFCFASGYTLFFNKTYKFLCLKHLNVTHRVKFDTTSLTESKRYFGSYYFHYMKVH